jgi:hypothetical protein
MNELQKLNYVSYNVILLNTGYFPFGSGWTARYPCLYVSIACAALLVDATPGSLATPDVSALRRSRNFLIHSANVVLGLFDSLDSALFARALSRCFWRILLFYFGFIARFVFFFVFLIFNLLLLITFELQTFVYLRSSHFTKLNTFYTYV